MIWHRTVAIVLASVAALAWPSPDFGKVNAVAAGPGLAAPKAGDFWLAPEPVHVTARQSLARAVASLAAGRPAESIRGFEAAVSDPTVGGYALLFLGRAQLALARTAEANKAAQRLAATSPTGYLEEAGLWLASDAASAASDWAGALVPLQRLAVLPGVASPAMVHMRLGRVAVAAGATELAARAFSTIYFDYPLAPEAGEAKTELNKVAPAAMRI